MRREWIVFLPLMVVSALLACGCTTQRSFSSPEATADALVHAARARDFAQMQSLFGPEFRQIRSGDPQQDTEDLQRFAAAYDRKHELRPAGEGSYQLL
ncbi:MAG: DUF2950 family protein, partial [Phycisphaerales bacterium]|nr:DUF2950 family protein [Phycisphaerales bacterium]